MKGLFLAFGLIAALFISNNVQASIYDTATSLPPKNHTVTLFTCVYKDSSQTDVTTKTESIDACMFLVSSNLYTPPAKPDPLSKGDKWHIIDGVFKRSTCTDTSCDILIKIISYEYIQIGTSGSNFTIIESSPHYTAWGRASNPKLTQSISCPPDANPNYIYEYDSNLDGKPEKCYDPRELDNVSKCADLFNSGSILSTGTNVAPLVCKEFEDGSRCAFSRVNQGTTPYYQPNLEVGCFGDGNLIPKYDPSPNDPQPQPEQCVPYAGGYACSADPNQYCSADHRCVNGCGYVNDQFICFRDQKCTGASCEPAPINCENSPDAPVCKEQQTIPEPTFCEKNPTVQSCQSGSDFCKKNPLAPSCQLGGDNGGGTGGGGGSEFSLDYEKLINGMKDAVKLIIDPSETPEFSEFKSEIDDKTSELDSDIDAFMNGSHFDSINDQIGTNPFSDKLQLPSGGGCTAFELGGHPLDLCDAAQKISSVLYFVFAFLTLLHLKHLFFSTITPRKE